MCVVEGVNMLFIFEVIVEFVNVKVIFVFGKVFNVGGVVIFGFEMFQNFLCLSWIVEEVDFCFYGIMVFIYEVCVKYGKGEDGYIDYVKGVNIVGFVKVVDVMIDQGLV